MRANWPAPTTPTRRRTVGWGSFDTNETLVVKGTRKMRIAIGLDTTGSIEKTLSRASRLRDAGFSSLWSSQIFGPDTLTVLAIVGREHGDLDLGTAVVPIHPRHPSMLAAQARTVQDAIGGHLSLGVGLSHQMVVEGMWGSPLSARPPLCASTLTPSPLYFAARRSTCTGTSDLGHPGSFRVEEVSPPSLLIAALGTKMLELAGTVADGTLLWMTGRQTIAAHITPTIRAAAEKAGRPAPRIVCSLPIAVTSDVTGAKERINSEYALYATLPSYAAMLEREGTKDPAGASLIGPREQVLEQLHQLADAGVTEFSGAPSGNQEESEGAIQVLLDFQGGA